MLEKLKSFAFPKIGSRIIKTLISVFLVAITYDFALGGRNPCFACIGAVYGMGSFFSEGIKHGGNRFVGTLLGGLVVIPFYWLYHNTPFGIPNYVFLIIGAFLTIYINLIFGANSAVQPSTVVYFVVIFTQAAEMYIPYTIARIIDTGAGVLCSLVINAILPSPHEQNPKLARHKKAAIF